MEAQKGLFGLEVIRMLKERKLTQRALAQYLSVTPAAVCYLLQNVLHPSAAQFDKIMEFLQAEANDVARLRRLWFATQEKSIPRSEEAINLFSIRCAKGVSLETVAAETGISEERLRYLENKAGAIPTAEENARLRGYYGDAPEQLDDSNDEFKLAESVAEELCKEALSGEVTLPVLSLDVLSRAAKAGTLSNFLGALPFNNTTFKIDACHRERAKAVLVCDAEEIHYGFPGKLRIVLADPDPLYADRLFIGRGQRGGFTLWQKMNNSWKYCGSETPAPRMLNAWSVPVLELNFISAPATKDFFGKER